MAVGAIIDKTIPHSRVTIHMAASLDGFIARKDGRVDWMETSDEFAGGDTMDLTQFVSELRSRFKSIWFVGGGVVGLRYDVVRC